MLQVRLAPSFLFLLSEKSFCRHLRCLKCHNMCICRWSATIVFVDSRHHLRVSRAPAGVECSDRAMLTGAATVFLSFLALQWHCLKKKTPPKKQPSALLSVHCLDCRRELNPPLVLNHSQLQQLPEAKKHNFACKHFCNSKEETDFVWGFIQTMLPDACKALLQIVA